MVEDNLVNLQTDGLLDCFDRTLDSFSLLAWDGSGESVCEGIPDALAEIPMYVFQFEGNGNETLVLTNSSSILASQCKSLNRETALGLAKAAEPEADFEARELLAAVDMTDHLMPFDPLMQIPLAATKASAVHLESGELIGLMIWFNIGTQIGFIKGPYGELATVYGTNVDAAYKNAVEHQSPGKVKIVEREYSLAASENCLKLNEWDWFQPNT